MHLAEILLPMNDNSGRLFGAEKYAAARTYCGPLRRIDGVHPLGKQIVHDDIVVFEVMTEKARYAMVEYLSVSFGNGIRQDDVVIRASAITSL